ncbi:hypothetical protein BGZ58_004912, partial [Dissophora ornata]
YQGDILIGANGADCGVRQSLQKQLNEKNLIPKEDLESMSIGYVSMVGNRKETDKLSEKVRTQHFLNSEWGPEANEAMVKESEDKPCPLEGKMGDIIEATPKDLISKCYANCLFSIRNSSPKSITAAFEEYYTQRFHRAEEQLLLSGTMGKLTSGQTWAEYVFGYITLNYIPD